MKRILRIALISLAGLLGAGIAQSSLAGVVYTYTGNNFNSFVKNGSVPGDYDTTMSVSGWFEVDTALAPNPTLSDVALTSYSFTDGRTTFTDANSNFVVFQIATNPSGNISSWSIALTMISGIEYFSLNTGTFGTDVYDQGTFQPYWGNNVSVYDIGQIYSRRGSWSVAVAEPGTLALLGLGLAGLGFTRRRKSA